MKMRAKMVDGSPVTFEQIDWGGRNYVADDSKLMIGPPYKTEYVGEGFHVISMWHGQPCPDTSSSSGHRLTYDRWSLHRAGVDTSTVEFWNRPYHGAISGMDYWERLWPRVTRFDDFTGYSHSFGPNNVRGRFGEEPREPLVNGDMMMAGADILRIYKASSRMDMAAEVYKAMAPKTWPPEPSLVGEAMIAAGAAKLKDMIHQQGIIRDGEVWFRSPTIVLTAIWQAMMTAKKRGG